MSSEKPTEDLDIAPNRLVPFKQQAAIYKAGLYISASIIAFVMGLPIYWMFQSSLRTRASIQSGITQFFPTMSTFTIERYTILFNPVVRTYIVNSVIVTVGTVLLVVVISLISGYGLARFDYRFKVNFARILLTGYMFSAIVIGLPLFLIWKRVGLVNNPLGLILALSAGAMPFCVWVMWKYIQTIPSSLEESAWMAGASRWRGFVDIVLPQCAPGLIAVALFSFAIAWGDFTYAQILMPAQEAQTFPVGILRLINQGYATTWGDILAAGFFMSIPPLIFAYFLQSYLLKGFELR